LKLRLLPALVLAVFGFTAQAKSATLVYLVGLRHVYSIPAYPDAHQLDRQQIEEDYAAAVADAQKHYDADMASIHDEEAKDSGNVHQEDRDQVQQNLEKDIADAADKREAAFAEIYPVCDTVRASHPEFSVEQDGPYKVIEVETAPTGEYTNVVYYQPYPMYMDVCPYGWAWGQPYPYMAWGVQCRLFHSMWITWGSPFFAPMYYGGVVFVFNAPIRNDVIVNRSTWVGGRPPHITVAERSVLGTNYATQRTSGYFDRGPGGKPLSEFNKVGTASSSRYSNSRTTGISKYSRTGTSSIGTGASSQTGVSRYSGSGTSSTSGVSRYHHTLGSSTGSSSSSSTGGSRYSRSTGSSTGTGSTTTGGSRYSHSAGTAGSTTGSASHGAQNGTSSGGSGAHGSTGSSGSGSSTDTQKKKGNNP